MAIYKNTINDKINKTSLITPEGLIKINWINDNSILLVILLMWIPGFPYSKATLSSANKVRTLESSLQCSEILRDPNSIEAYSVLHNRELTYQYLNIENKIKFISKLIRVVIIQKNKNLESKNGRFLRRIYHAPNITKYSNYERNLN